MKKRPLFILIAVLAFGLSTAQAQNLSEEEILQNLEASAESLEDASFLLTGKLVDMDGTEIPLEVEVDTIPDQELARAYFIQPDALADNFIVYDDDTVYNYLYLTNQVQVFDASDPDALGGLFPEAEETAEEVEQEFNFTLNLERLFEGWEMDIQGYEETPAGNAYVLRFTNRQQGANIGHVEARVLDETWLPYQLTFVQPDGSVMADLFFENVQRDQGLDPEELREIPADAEVIDER